MTHNGLVQFEQRDAIGFVTLNRPDQLNALSEALIGALQTTFDHIAADDGIRIVVVTGSGRAFCAGSDIKELDGISVEEARRINTLEARVCGTVEELPQTTIAAVNGYALGGGFGFVLSHDIRVASDRAVFGGPEVKHGWSPPFGLTQAVRILGPDLAKELHLTGRHVNAEEALQCGAAHRVVPHDSLLDSCEELAHELATHSPTAMRALKRLTLQQAGNSLMSGLDVEMEAFLECFSTPEAKEGIRAFVDKRGKQ